MKKTIILSILLVAFLNTNAQTIQFNRGAHDDTTIDSSGNIINVGGVSDTSDDFYMNDADFKFDVIRHPAGGVYPHGFISKLSNAGNLLWVKVFNTETINNGHSVFSRIHKVVTDENDNIYVSGAYSGIMHLDETTTLNSGTTDNKNSFLLKLDTNGNLIWYKEYLDHDIPNNGFDTVDIADISFKNSKLHVGLEFKGNTDFGFKDNASLPLISESSGNGNKVDLVLITYNDNGDENTIRRITAEDLGFNSLDNVSLLFRDFYVSDTKTTILATTGTSRTLIIIKLLQNNVIDRFFTMSVQNSFSTYLLENVEEDSNKNIFISGRILGTADIDPDSSVLKTVTASSLSDILILKLNENYEYVWHKQLPNSNPSHAQLLVESKIVNDNIFIFGNVRTGGSSTYDLSGENNTNTTIVGESGFYISEFSGTDGSFVNTLFLKYYSTNNPSPPFLIGTSLVYYNNNFFITGPLLSHGSIEFLDKKITLEVYRYGHFISKLSLSDLKATLSNSEIALVKNDVKVFQVDNHFDTDKKDFTLKVYNILGKEIENRNLKPGVYLIKVNDKQLNEYKVFKRIIR